MELNLTKEYPTKIYVGTESKGDFQPVVMENRSDFCFECHKRGHLRSDCWRNPECKNASGGILNVRMLHNSKEMAVL